MKQINKSAKFNIAIVGAGIAAECFKHYFFTQLKNYNFSVQIDQYSSPLAPATSDTTTSIISRRGLKRNLSELGDTLDDAYHEFKHFISIYPNTSGLLETKIIHRCSHGDEKAIGKFIRRFGKVNELENYLEITESAFVVENLKFINWFQENQQLKVNHITKFIHSPDQLETYDFVFYFTGSSGKFFDMTGSKIVDQSILAHGSFLQLDNFNDPENIFSDNLVFEIDGIDLIYRKNSKELLIGASTANIDFQLSHDIVALKKFHEHLVKFFNLPAFDEFNFVSGQRLKGKKRLPTISVGDKPNSFVVNALYKNGYTLCFLGAKRACEYFFDFIKCHQA